MCAYYYYLFIMASYTKYNMIKTIKEKSNKKVKQQWLSSLQYN